VKVLLVVIDAASPRVMCPAVVTGRLPNLKRLADAGEMHEQCVTIFPSITPAATTSIITGAYPARHGIAGASWLDEARREVVYYGDDVWVIAKKGFGAFFDDFLVRLNGDRLKAPTIFERVEAAGRHAACLNYLVHKGRATHEVHVPKLLGVLPGVSTKATVLGPQTLWLGNFVGPRHQRGIPVANLFHRFGIDDDTTADMLERLVSTQPLPDFTVAYFPDNDYKSHDVGPSGAYPVLERVDEALGAMFDAAGGFERFIDGTCVIVTSDHGHSEVLADADSAVIRLPEVLSAFQQADVAKGWRDGDEILICPNMRAAQIYLNPRSPATAEVVADALLREPRHDLVVWRDPAAVAADCRYVAISPRGRLTFSRGSCYADRGRDVFGNSWSWRGDLSVLAAQREGATIEFGDYPNAFERLAGALELSVSGDIWVTAQPGCEFEAEGGKPHCGGASHGALHALESLSPLIVANGPRKLPRAVRSVDIARLVMEAMDLDAA
jgi:hypothetical protein